MQPVSKTTTPEELAAIFSTPKKKVLLTQSLDGHIAIPITPNTRTEQNAIYMFRQKSNGQVYIGKTEQSIGQRLLSHM